MQVSRAPRRHLAPSELIDRTHACPICLTTSPRRAVFRVHADPDVHMLACPNCRACSASHMPSADVLARYYESYYDDRDSEVTFSAPLRFAKHVVKAIPRDAFGSHLRILDFGGGDGSLAKAIAERLITLDRIRTAEILVIDLVTREDAPGPAVSVRHQGPDATIDTQHDLVLASAILEHLPDLNPVLKTLHASMAEDGFFYARTPYVIPLTRIFPRLDLTYPAHVHDMGNDFWNRFSATFQWSTRVVASRPSIVAGNLLIDPLRTFAATVLKAPAHVENWLSPRSRPGRVWNMVGGWEVLLQKKRPGRAGPRRQRLK